MDDVIGTGRKAAERGHPHYSVPGEVDHTWSALKLGSVRARNPASSPDSAARNAIDMLRTRAAATMRENGWNTLAITAPAAGCGTTMMSIELAAALARQRNTRVILVDLNLRNPAIAHTLGLEGRYSASNFLDGTMAPPDALVKLSDQLAILPNTVIANNPAELLQSEAAVAAIEQLQRQLAPDFMVFDLPPMLDHDDLLGFLPAVDCALLVLGAERSTVGEADLCERELAARGKLLGLVLNQCRLGLGELDV